MQHKYPDGEGGTFDVYVRTTADMLSSPQEQLVTFIDIARQQKWPVGLDDLHRVADEATRLPPLNVPETYVLVMTFDSPVETFVRYIGALRERVHLHIQAIDMDAIPKALQLNPACRKPKPGLSWWRINLEAHMPSLAEEVRYQGGVKWGLHNVCSNVQSLNRSDLAHSSVLAMALMHPQWSAVDGRLNGVRMGGYLYVRDPKNPSGSSVVELHRGTVDSSGRRLYGLDLIWWGNSWLSPIPTARPIRFGR